MTVLLLTTFLYPSVTTTKL